MAWFSRERSGAEGSGEGEKRVRTEGLWLKCEGCGQIIWKKTLDENGQVCPQCNHHFRVDARTRLGLLFDGGTYEEVDASLTSTDPLKFSDSRTYASRLAEMQVATAMSDALVAGWGLASGWQPSRAPHPRTRQVRLRCLAKLPQMLCCASYGRM